MPSLLFITSTRIGDAVLSTGALALARARLPGAKVTIACGPLAAPLFRAEPDLEELVAMTKTKQGMHWFELWRTIAGKRFDLAVDLRGSALTYLVAARRRLVFTGGAPGMHKLDALAALFGEAKTPATHIALDERAHTEAAALSSAGRPLLVLAPNANWPAKTWPLENFQALAIDLVGKDGPLAGGRVVLLGAREDGAALCSLQKGLRTAGLDAKASSGDLDLLACAALLSRATLFVGNDSGLMHLAGAVSAPTLGLFGPTDERVYGPRGPRARALRGARAFEELSALAAAQRGRVSLMEDIAVEAVAAAAREMIA